MAKNPNQIDALNLKNWLNSEYDQPKVIDVREDMELEIAKFSYTNIHIPMSKVSLDFVNSKINNFQENKYVIICHMGIRSFAFGQWLLDNKFLGEVWNLEEGIDGWSRFIDKSIPRY